MKTLHVMVGLPRSGKTTKAIAMGLPIVNPDSVRLALHGERFLSDAEPMVWTISKYMVKALFIAGHNDIILDATNTTKKRRDEWISSKWETEFIHIDTPESVCLDRAKYEGDFEIIPIIKKMAAQFEPF